MTLTKTANQSTVTVSGHKIEMHKGGSGPPLLFLHGGGGFGTFDPTSSPLADKFTVYAPSHPGFFGSARPDWLYTINDLSHFYKDMVQQLGLDDYVLVGHSVGGWIAAEMAAMDHHNIKGLVLIDAAGVRPVNGEIAEVFMVSGDTRLKLAFHDEPVLVKVAVPVGAVAGYGRIRDQGNHVALVLNDALRPRGRTHLLDDIRHD